VNFHQAPITRYLRLQDRAASPTANELTVAPQTFSATAPAINASTWMSGRAVNVFFETPTWPSSTFSINLEYNHSGGGGAGGSPLLVAPNVMIEDGGNVSGVPNVTNHFIRGNVAFLNTLNTVINVTYCGVLTNVTPLGARASAANYAWVQPTDILDVSDNNQIAHNLTTNQDITVQAVRAKGGPDSYYVEFNAPLDLDGTGMSVGGGNATGFPTSPAATGVAAIESSYDFTLKYANNTFKKLAVDGLTLAVIGKDSGGTPAFTGTLVGSVNLTYANNNKTGLIAGLFDPSRFMQVSRAWANANFRPLSTVGITAFNTQRISVDRDYVSGAEPYRCIAIINSGTAATYPQIAITINPIS